MTTKYIDPEHKILYFLPKIEEWLAGKPIFPLNIELDVSNACQLNCNYCLYGYTHDNVVMPFDLARRILDEVVSVGVKSITYSGGGEPLTNPNFGEIVAYGNKKGLSQGLYTNGLLVDRFLIPIVRYLKWVHFSVFAGTPETYNKITDRDVFEKVIDNIKLLAKHREDLVIGMGMVVSDDNIHEVEAYYRLAQELRVNFCGFKPDCWITDKDKLLSMWTKIDKLPDTNVSKTPYRFIRQAEGRPYTDCWGHYFIGCIGASGDLWFCGSKRSIPEYSLGNLASSSFKELWLSSKHDELMRNLDLIQCMPACRPDVLNTLLHKLSHPNPHAEFL